MPLSAAAIRAAVDEHMRAESERDMGFLRHQLVDDVDYVIKSPCHPNDPTPYGHFVGSATYIDMWDRLHEIFSRYAIEIEDTIVLEERQAAFVRLRITATPREEWNGLPAGEPVCWFPAAICEFDDRGHMTRETVWGSLPPILAGYGRTREFHTERGTAAD
jgi:hypothetical protein